jgi:hypothetical protein
VIKWLENAATSEHFGTTPHPGYPVCLWSAPPGLSRVAQTAKAAGQSFETEGTERKRRDKTGRADHGDGQIGTGGIRLSVAAGPGLRGGVGLGHGKIA